MKQSWDPNDLEPANNMTTSADQPDHHSPLTGPDPGHQLWLPELSDMTFNVEILWTNMLLQPDYSQ